MSYSYIFRIIIVGDSGCGKTNLSRSFIHHSFSPEQPTIGVEFESHIIHLGETCTETSCRTSSDTSNGTNHRTVVSNRVSDSCDSFAFCYPVSVKLQLWDTSGQERFNALTRSYYQNAAGALIVCDATCPISITHVKKWLQDVYHFNGSDCTVMVVINKMDLVNHNRHKLNDFRDSACVKELLAYCQEQKIHVFEVSAKTRENVQACFQTLAQKIYQSCQSCQLSQQPRTGQQSNQRPGIQKCVERKDLFSTIDLNPLNDPDELSQCGQIRRRDLSNEDTWLPVLKKRACCRYL